MTSIFHRLFRLFGCFTVVVEADVRSGIPTALIPELITEGILLHLSQNSNSLEENTNEGRLSFESVPHPGLMPTSRALHQPPDPTVLEDQNNSNQILVNVSPKVRPAKKTRVRPGYTIVESVASSSNQSVIAPVAVGRNKNILGIQKQGASTVINCGGNIYFNNGECSTSTSYLPEIHAELQNMKNQLKIVREQNHVLIEEVSRLTMQVNELSEAVSFHFNQINCNIAFFPNFRDPRDPFGEGGSGAGMGFVAG